MTSDRAVPPLTVYAWPDGHRRRWVVATPQEDGERLVVLYDEFDAARPDDFVLLRGEALPDRPVFAVPSLAVRAPLPPGALPVGAMTSEAHARLVRRVGLAVAFASAERVVAGRSAFALRAASDLAALRNQLEARRRGHAGAVLVSLALLAVIAVGATLWSARGARRGAASQTPSWEARLDRLETLARTTRPLGARGTQGGAPEERLKELVRDADDLVGVVPRALRSRARSLACRLTLREARCLAIRHRDRDDAERALARADSILRADDADGHARVLQTGIRIAGAFHDAGEVARLNPELQAWLASGADAAGSTPDAPADAALVTARRLHMHGVAAHYRFRRTHDPVALADARAALLEARRRLHQVSSEEKRWLAAAVDLELASVLLDSGEPGAARSCLTEEAASRSGLREGDRLALDLALATCDLLQERPAAARQRLAPYAAALPAGARRDQAIAVQVLDLAAASEAGNPGEENARAQALDRLLARAQDTTGASLASEVRRRLAAARQGGSCPVRRLVLPCLAPLVSP